MVYSAWVVYTKILLEKHRESTITILSNFQSKWSWIIGIGVAEEQVQYYNIQTGQKQEIWSSQGINDGSVTALMRSSGATYFFFFCLISFGSSLDIVLT